jgi:hypothetical protein
MSSTAKFMAVIAIGRAVSSSFQMVSEVMRTSQATSTSIFETLFI